MYREDPGNQVMPDPEQEPSPELMIFCITKTTNCVQFEPYHYLSPLHQPENDFMMMLIFQTNTYSNYYLVIPWSGLR